MKFSIVFLSLLTSFFLNAQKPELKQLLSDISVQAIQLNEQYFSQEQVDQKWIGYSPCVESDIKQLEKKLGIEIPADFKEFLLITNGFHDANGIEPSFCAISNIDYVRNTDPELVKIWKTYTDKNNWDKLNSAIQVGGFGEEQQFFLIPPGKHNKNWEYWHFAAWMPGETSYDSLLDYFIHVREMTEHIIETK